MAERPGELNDNTAADVADDKITTQARTVEKLDSTDDFDEVDSKENETNDAASGDPDQIRENIEETRAEMSETINAIQEKLSFSNISEQVKAEVSDYVGETIETAKNTVYDAVTEKGKKVMSYVDKGINEIADMQVVKTATRNPLALGLIGLGLGLLYFSSSSKSNKRHSKFRYDENYDRDNRSYGRGYSSSGGKSTFEAAQNKIGSAASAVGDTVSSAAGAVSDTVSSAAGAVSDTVGNVAGTAYKQAGNLGAKAGDLAETAQDTYEYYMEENPLAVGAVAMALGAAVGLAFPSTSVENRYMGEARNNLLQKAEETARDAVGKVQQVAGQVGDSVKKEAKNQGLT